MVGCWYLNIDKTNGVDNLRLFPIVINQYNSLILKYIELNAVIKLQIAKLVHIIVDASMNL